MCARAEVVLRKYVQRSLMHSVKGRACTATECKVNTPPAMDGKGRGKPMKSAALSMMIRSAHLASAIALIRKRSATT